MHIGEAAKRTELTIDAIRFYERRSLLPKPLRTEGRFRLYTDADLTRLAFIRQMQGLGFSLREVKQLVELRARKVEACSSVRELLKVKLAKVRGKIVDLKKLETELAADLRKCDRELGHRKQHKACACPVLES